VLERDDNAVLFSTSDASHAGLRRISSQEEERRCRANAVDASDEFTRKLPSHPRSSNSRYYFFIPDNDNGDPFANNSGGDVSLLTGKEIDETSPWQSAPIRVELRTKAYVRNLRSLPEEGGYFRAVHSEESTRAHI